MIKIENVVLPSADQMEAVIRGMRNPKNSWDKSDSINDFYDGFVVGPNDEKLMATLANAGTDHGKFLRMMVVFADLTAPLYWWKEYDTYKIGTVANSCSTMHKIHAKEFVYEDFSADNLTDDASDVLEYLIYHLNQNRQRFLDTGNKAYWYNMIKLLPENYNQKRTVMTNYAVLKNIYHSRKNHKLDEWHILCHWIESLPYSELITGGEI